MGQQQLDLGTAITAAGHYKIHYDLNEGGWFSVWFTQREWDGNTWFDRRMHRYHVRLEHETLQLWDKKDLALYALSVVREMM